MGIQIGKLALNNEDRLDFLKNLSGWLGAGGGTSSVGEAVANTCDAFSFDEYATLRPKMDLIKSDVSRGQITLYEALLNADVGFTVQELNILEAAERSNQLREAIPALIAALQIQSRGRRELFTKLAGPLALGAVLLLMTIGVLVYMLPLVLTPVLERKPEAIDKFPLILKYFWFTSVWLRANYLIPMAVAGAPTVFLLLRNTPMFSPAWQSFIMWFSLSRRLIIGFNSLIVVYFMPALLRSGMPTYRVLYSLADCLSNKTLAIQMRIAGSDHENGLRMQQALQILPFKSSFINAIHAGEQIGNVADRVADLQEPYSIEMERLLKKIASALKGIVMGIFLPLFIVSAYTALVGPIFALMEY
jgi:type II secretory pathway component PulF